jgi:hypothetical protein
MSHPWVTYMEYHLWYSTLKLAICLTNKKVFFYIINESNANKNDNKIFTPKKNIYNFALINERKLANKIMLNFFTN